MIKHTKFQLYKVHFAGSTWKNRQLLTSIYLTLSRRRLSYRNQWAGFYMITASVMKGLNEFDFSYIKRCVSKTICSEKKLVTSYLTNSNNFLFTNLTRFRSAIKRSSNESFTRTYLQFESMENVFPKLETTKSLVSCSTRICKVTENNSYSRLFTEFNQTRKRYYISIGKLKTICHLKPKLFLSTKLPENLLLMKYLISVSATLTHLLALHPSSTPRKHQKTIRFSDVFKG